MNIRKIIMIILGLELSFLGGLTREATVFAMNQVRMRKLLKDQMK